MGKIVRGIRELVRHKVFVGILIDQTARKPYCPVCSLLCRSKYHLSSVGPYDFPSLYGDCRTHDYLYRIALYYTHYRKPYSGIARCRLYDCLSRTQSPVPLGLLYHFDCNPVLYAPRRIEPFDLCENIYIGVRRQPVYLHHRRSAYGLKYILLNIHFAIF